MKRKRKRKSGVWVVQTEEEKKQRIRMGEEAVTAKELLEEILKERRKKK